MTSSSPMISRIRYATAITAAVATGDGTPRRSSRWRTGCATITTSAAMARVPIGPRAR